MRITRREFLKWAATSAAALGLSQLDLLRLEKVLADSSAPPVIWIQGASCSGCAISLLNVTDPTTVDDVLLNHISLKYHPNLSAVAGHMAMEKIEYEMIDKMGQFILVVEGSVPTSANGKYCIVGEKTDGTPWTMYQAVQDLAAKAKYVIAAGTCAAFGGIPGGNPNPTSVVHLDEIVEKNKVVNLPACPVHPTHLVKVILELISTGMPALDGEGRPKAFFSRKLHSNCPRRGTSRAKKIGEFGCMNGLGCNGPNTYIDCPLVKWNNGVNWCIGSNHPCIGCAYPGFPDAVSPFYKF
ncbi:[NiFe] hydrogenase small subunit HydA [Anoxybacter fermentans]|uniref:[NiFe] hydrogenase small subunit HydA n=2 Tax=Anoxybacter fermentans TaxID=1323375 RepID=A0A3S9SX85_9FIRM|nr:[NiFe] hydrogenase small subunit HydA [Anoxybacter fermentans]